MKSGGSRSYTVNSVRALLCGPAMVFQNIQIIALIVDADLQE